MILWVAPIGAFGAIADVVGETGWDAVMQLATLMLGVLHHLPHLRVRRARRAAVAGHRVSIFKLVRYLAREYLLIVATSSSESALPRLIAKMEHARRGAQPRSASLCRPATRSTSTAPRST